MAAAAAVLAAQVAAQVAIDLDISFLQLLPNANVRIPCQNLYIPRPKHLKKQGGPSAGSPFEQISMQRLTGVPSSISGGAGWVGSSRAGICKGWAGLNERRNEGLRRLVFKRPGLCCLKPSI